MNIRLAKKSAPYGVKVPEFKLTAASPIEPAPLPGAVVLPLQQCLGAPSRAVVKRGDKVLKGQKIADSDRPVSAPVHATLSGEITGSGTTINPVTGGVMETITITSDGQDQWISLDVPKDPGNLPPEEIVRRVREAGIVGLGGATFPTHIKLAPPKNKRIDTVILNGCECEPYITSDYRVMLEYGEKVLSGASLIRKVLNAEAVIVAIEDNKEDAIEHFEKIIQEKGYSFQIAPIKTKYPGGAEKTLVKTILKREVPIGGLPLDVEVVVQNVSTAKAVHDAIYEGRPLSETSTVAILVGGLILIALQIVDWRIPLTYLGTVVVLSFAFGEDPLFQLMAGGLMLGAFFMATDYVTCPLTHRGRAIFGFGCGLMTMVIRLWGGLPEGVCYSILFMNAMTPFIDRYVKVRPLGLRKAVKNAT